MADEHHRYDALDTLTAFLEGRMDAEGLYQWALKKATAADYAAVIAEDLLMKELIETILEIHTRSEGDDQTGSDELKSVWLKAMAHYHACLSGTRVFVPQDDVIRSLVFEKHEDHVHPKKQVLGTQWLRFFRAYVLLFAMSIIIAYGLTLWDPTWLFPEGTLSRAVILKEAWPLWVYGAVVVVPPQIWARGPMFYPALMVLAAGMVYFWHMTIRLITPVQWHPGFVLLVAMTATIPSTLALLMVVEVRAQERKRCLDRQENLY